jgi:hypothetical protein
MENNEVNQSLVRDMSPLFPDSVEIEGEERRKRSRIV